MRVFQSAIVVAVLAATGTTTVTAQGEPLRVGATYESCDDLNGDGSSSTTAVNDDVFNCMFKEGVPPGAIAWVAGGGASTHSNAADAAGLAACELAYAKGAWLGDFDMKTGAAIANIAGFGCGGQTLDQLLLFNSMVQSGFSLVDRYPNNPSVQLGTFALCNTTLNANLEGKCTHAQCCVAHVATSGPFDDEKAWPVASLGTTALGPGSAEVEVSSTQGGAALTLGVFYTVKTIGTGVGVPWVNVGAPNAAPAVGTRFQSTGVALAQTNAVDVSANTASVVVADFGLFVDDEIQNMRALDFSDCIGKASGDTCTVGCKTGSQQLLAGTPMTMYVDKNGKMVLPGMAKNGETKSKFPINSDAGYTANRFLKGTYLAAQPTDKLTKDNSGMAGTCRIYSCDTTKATNGVAGFDYGVLTAYATKDYTTPLGLDTASGTTGASTGGSSFMKVADFSVASPTLVHEIVATTAIENYDITNAVITPCDTFLWSASGKGGAAFAVKSETTQRACSDVFTDTTSSLLCANTHGDTLQNRIINGYSSAGWDSVTAKPFATTAPFTFVCNAAGAFPGAINYQCTPNVVAMAGSINKVNTPAGQGDAAIAAGELANKMLNGVDFSACEGLATGATCNPTCSTGFSAGTVDSDGFRVLADQDGVLYVSNVMTTSAQADLVTNSGVGVLSDAKGSDAIESITNCYSETTVTANFMEFCNVAAGAAANPGSRAVANKYALKANQIHPRILGSTFADLMTMTCTENGCWKGPDAATRAAYPGVNWWLDENDDNIEDTSETYQPILDALKPSDISVPVQNEAVKSFQNTKSSTNYGVSVVTPCLRGYSLIPGKSVASLTTGINTCNADNTFTVTSMVNICQPNVAVNFFTGVNTKNDGYDVFSTPTHGKEVFTGFAMVYSKQRTTAGGTAAAVAACAAAPSCDDLGNKAVDTGNSHFNGKDYNTCIGLTSGQTCTPVCMAGFATITANPGGFKAEVNALGQMLVGKQDYPDYPPADDTTGYFDGTGTAARGNLWDNRANAYGGNGAQADGAIFAAAAITDVKLNRAWNLADTLECQAYPCNAAKVVNGGSFVSYFTCDGMTSMSSCTPACGGARNVPTSPTVATAQLATGPFYTTSAVQPVNVGFYAEFYTATKAPVSSGNTNRFGSSPVKAVAAGDNFLLLCNADGSFDAQSSFECAPRDCDFRSVLTTGQAAGAAITPGTLTTDLFYTVVSVGTVANTLSAQGAPAGIQKGDRFKTTGTMSAWTGAGTTVKVDAAFVTDLATTGYDFSSCAGMKTNDTCVPTCKAGYTAAYPYPTRGLIETISCGAYGVVSTPDANDFANQLTCTVQECLVPSAASELGGADYKGCVSPQAGALTQFMLAGDTTIRVTATTGTMTLIPEASTAPAEVVSATSAGNRFDFSVNHGLPTHDRAAGAGGAPTAAANTQAVIGVPFMFRSTDKSTNPPKKTALEKTGPAASTVVFDQVYCTGTGTTLTKLAIHSQFNADGSCKLTTASQEIVLDTILGASLAQWHSFEIVQVTGGCFTSQALAETGYNSAAATEGRTACETGAFCSLQTSGDAFGYCGGNGAITAASAGLGNYGFKLGCEGAAANGNPPAIFNGEFADPSPGARTCAMHTCTAGAIPAAGADLGMNVAGQNSIKIDFAKACEGLKNGEQCTLKCMSGYGTAVAGDPFVLDSNSQPTVGGIATKQTAVMHCLGAGDSTTKIDNVAGNNGKLFFQGSEADITGAATDLTTTALFSTTNSIDSNVLTGVNGKTIYPVCQHGICDADNVGTPIPGIDYGSCVPSVTGSTCAYKCTAGWKMTMADASLALQCDANGDFTDTNFGKTGNDGCVINTCQEVDYSTAVRVAADTSSSATAAEAAGETLNYDSCVGKTSGQKCTPQCPAGYAPVTPASEITLVCGEANAGATDWESKATDPTTIFAQLYSTAYKTFQFNGANTLTCGKTCSFGATDLATTTDNANYAPCVGLGNGATCTPTCANGYFASTAATGFTLNCPDTSAFSATDPTLVCSVGAAPAATAAPAAPAATAAPANPANPAASTAAPANPAVTAAPASAGNGKAAKMSSTSLQHDHNGDGVVDASDHATSAGTGKAGKAPAAAAPAAAAAPGKAAKDAKATKATKGAKVAKDAKTTQRHTGSSKAGKATKESKASKAPKAPKAGKVAKDAKASKGETSKAGKGAKSALASKAATGATARKPVAYAASGVAVVVVLAAVVALATKHGLGPLSSAAGDVEEGHPLNAPGVHPVYA